MICVVAPPDTCIEGPSKLKALVESKCFLARGYSVTGVTSRKLLIVEVSLIGMSTFN